MRFAKLLLLSFVILFAIATAVSALIPSRVRISRAVNLGKDQSVFALVRDTNRWKQWNPVFMNDSFIRANPISIRPVQDSDTLITMELQQGQRQPILSGWELHRYPSTDTVTLQWYLDFRLKWYPWQKIGSLFYEGTYGSMLETGLANLKRVGGGEN